MFATDVSVTEDVHILLLQSSHYVFATTELIELAPVSPSHTVQRLAQVLAGIAGMAVVLFFVYDGFYELRAKGAKRRKPSIQEFALLTAFGALEWFLSDQFLPCIPDIAAEFQVPESYIGATLQIHQASSGLATLLVAPLSDRIGRKPVILAGCILLMVSTLCAGCAASYPWFLLGRCFQGVAQSACPVILAVLRDCFEDESERMLYLSAIGAVGLFGPMLAPSIGALLASHMGWRFSFLAIIPILAAIFVGLSYLFEETVPEESGQSLLAAAKRIFSNGRYCVMIVCQSSFVGLMLVSGGNHAKNLETIYGLSLVHCALVMSSLTLPAVVGLIVVNLLGWSPRTIYRAIIPLLVLTATLNILGGLFFSGSVYCYVAGFYMFSFSVVGLVVAVGTEFQQELPDIAGAAASVFQAGSLVGGATMSLPGFAVASRWAPTGMFFDAGAYLLLLALFSSVLALTSKGDDNDASASGVQEETENLPFEASENAKSIQPRVKDVTLAEHAGNAGT